MAANSAEATDLENERPVLLQERWSIVLQGGHQSPGPTNCSVNGMRLEMCGIILPSRVGSAKRE